MTRQCSHRHIVRIADASPDPDPAEIIVGPRIERQLLCRHQHHESCRRERLRHRRERERCVRRHASPAFLISPTKALLPDDLSTLSERYRHPARATSSNLSLNILPDRVVLVRALCRFNEQKGGDNRNSLHDTIPLSVHFGITDARNKKLRVIC